MQYILGFDLGPTSIGWAIVELNPDGKPIRLVDANSRIFLSMVEADTKVPKNKNRREKRSMRTQVKRYKLRRSRLISLLTERGFFGDEPLDPRNWEGKLNHIGNPFELRAEALERELTAMELARVFLHLFKRRGYKSNRGAKFDPLLAALREEGIRFNLENSGPSGEEDEADQSNEKMRETEKVLNGIRLLRQMMRETQWKPGQSCQTIAQLMVRLKEKEKWNEPRRPHTITRLELTKKGKEFPYHLYAPRELYDEEFHLIWERQARHHRELLTSELKLEIYQSIFSQNQLQSQRRKVGKCTLEMTKSRAAKALLEAQEFLLLEDLNKLAYSLPKKFGETDLEDEQRKAILKALADPEKLNAKGQLSWVEVKRIVGLPSKAKFNLERTSKNGLRGNRTHLSMLQTIPGKWPPLGEGRRPGESFAPLQIQLVQELVHIEDKKALFNRLTNRYQLPKSRNPWSFTNEEAFNLVTLELDEGYVKHCLHVIRKMLPSMRQGLMYSNAVQEAGCQRRDQIQERGCERLPEPPDVANPIVQKALFETRRVMNALIEKYGKPALVRIEMARDMKASKEHRVEMEKRQRENQKINDDVAKRIGKLAIEYPNLGIRVSREAIIKYKLWQEQGESCAYSYAENNHDRKISDLMLFDGTVEIDHIYPLSISLDDSYMNKVLCFRSENAQKGRETPWQAWHGTEKYNAILRRFDRTNLPSYPPEKLRRLKDDKFDANANFVAAQLNDTRYICVAVRNYLMTLGYNDQELQVSRGKMTAELRKLWGLSNILPRHKEEDEETDVETGKIGEKESAKKKDRGDHRHHAIDAIVTALVDRSVFGDLMRRYRYRENHDAWPDESLECPIPDLRFQAQRILMSNVVSHAAKRKVWGRLHDELPFGLGTYIDKSVPLKKLLRQPSIIRCESDGAPGKTLDGGERWIADGDVRATLQQWLDGYERMNNAKRKHYPMPMSADGKEIVVVDVANRCFVKRANVDTALAKVGNDPGKKTWIVDQGVRNVLISWLRSHKPTDVLIDPPRMPRKDGDMEKAHPILSVRLASKASSMVRFKDRPQIFDKGSNHHVVIFKRIWPDGVIERRGIFVDMLEAARRTRDLPIVRKDPMQLRQIDSAINPDEWKFEMALCSQDMVLWDDVDIQKRYPTYQQFGPQIYRLQKMTDQEITFRHFSVTSTGDKRGRIICSPNTMRCRKIRISSLGEWEVVGND